MVNGSPQVGKEMNDLDPFGSFHEASNSVLQHLHEVLGFDLWMVTRTADEDWIVLQAEDHGYGVQKGDVFRWADSFCSRMVKGLGPCIAPCSNDISAYATAAIGQQVPIGSYVGVPLRRHDGRLFGTMCAIHPTPRPEWITEKLQLVELFARLLSSILHAEIRASNESRRAERAQTEAMTDALTGLYNRRGWEKLIAAEEARCQRYGHPASMISIDLNGLKIVNDTLGHSKGDELIQLAAQVICAETRTQDVAARLGGDEFGILAVECDRQAADALLNGLLHAFLAAGISAAVGMSDCQPGRRFAETWDLADRIMYEEKRSRQTRRPGSLASCTTALVALPDESLLSGST